MVDFKELIKAGVHFGHRRSVWSPRMAPFIWGYKNNVHLIDVSKTAYNLEKAAQFLEQIAAEGKSILWVGTKKPAQPIIYAAATKLGMPYVTHRWIGGTLSNQDEYQITGVTTGVLRGENPTLWIDEHPVQEAHKGDIVTFKVADKVRRGDKLYKMLDS